MRDLLRDDDTLFSFERVMLNPIGYHQVRSATQRAVLWAVRSIYWDVAQFSRFAARRGDKDLLSFLYHVEVFLGTSLPSNRQLRAQRILTRFLFKTSTLRGQSPTGAIPAMPAPQLSGSLSTSAESSCQPDPIRLSTHRSGSAGRAGAVAAEGDRTASRKSSNESTSATKQRTVSPKERNYQRWVNHNNIMCSFQRGGCMGLRMRREGTDVMWIQRLLLDWLDESGEFPIGGPLASLCHILLSVEYLMGRTCEMVSRLSPEELSGMRVLVEEKLGSALASLDRGGYLESTQFVRMIWSTICSANKLPAMLDSRLLECATAAADDASSPTPVASEDAVKELQTPIVTLGRSEDGPWTAAQASVPVMRTLSALPEADERTEQEKRATSSSAPRETEQEPDTEILAVRVADMVNLPSPPGSVGRRHSLTSLSARRVNRRASDPGLSRAFGSSVVPLDLEMVDDPGPLSQQGRSRSPGPAATPSPAKSKNLNRTVSNLLGLLNRHAESLVGIAGSLPAMPQVIEAVRNCVEDSETIGTSSDLFSILAAVVLELLRAKHWIDFRGSPEWITFLQCVQKQKQPVSEKDFQLLRVVGRGGFGSVTACVKADTGRLYALKTMSKRRIREKHAESFVLNERAVLCKVKSPFVVGLSYAFQTEESLMLVQDLLIGGDLTYHLSISPTRCLGEERTRFYTAQLVLALESLHSQGIVYRDLKPENVLLDERGNAALVDLGLAAIVPPSGFISGRCGTRGYWAPEMLMRSSSGSQLYSYAVDWWSLGCVVYELLHGVCPFRSQQARAMDPKNKQAAMDMATLRLSVGCDPRRASPMAQRFIARLLTRDPRSRLGSRGAHEVRSHPWFTGINWEALEAGHIKPPFQPEVAINASSQASIGEFEIIKEGPMTDLEQSMYKDWNAVDPSAFQREMAEYLIWREVEEEDGPLVRVQSGCCCVM
jgi:serine/threonine protein kinase